MRSGPKLTPQSLLSAVSDIAKGTGATAGREAGLCETGLGSAGAAYRLALYL